MTESIVYDVAGRPVTVPLAITDASAGVAVFDVASAAVAERLPGTAFRVVEASPGRAQVTLMAIDYRDSGLGAYAEVAVLVPVEPRGGGEPGVFATHMPVSEPRSCAAGREIWGLPKTVDDVTLAYSATSSTADWSKDGELVLRLTVPRGGDQPMPALDLVVYSYVGGVPHEAPGRQQGRGWQFCAGGSGVDVELGGHPIGRELVSWGLAPSSVVLSTWTEHMEGILGVPLPVDRPLAQGPSRRST